MNFPGVYLLHLLVVRALGARRPGVAALRPGLARERRAGCRGLRRAVGRLAAAVARRLARCSITWPAAPGRPGQRDFLLCPLLLLGALGVARWLETTAAPPARSGVGRSRPGRVDDDQAAHRGAGRRARRHDRGHAPGARGAAMAGPLASFVVGAAVVPAAVAAVAGAGRRAAGVAGDRLRVPACRSTRGSAAPLPDVYRALDLDSDRQRRRAVGWPARWPPGGSARVTPSPRSACSTALVHFVGAGQGLGVSPVSARRLRARAADRRARAGAGPARPPGGGAAAAERRADAGAAHRQGAGGEPGRLGARARPRRARRLAAELAPRLRARRHRAGAGHDRRRHPRAAAPRRPRADALPVRLPLLSRRRPPGDPRAARRADPRARRASAPAHRRVRARAGRPAAASASTASPSCASAWRGTISFGPARTIESMHSATVKRIIRAYDDPIVRAYCWARFGILRQRFLDEIGQYLPEAGPVLDIGCGFGLFSLYYAATGPRRFVRGLDLSGAPHRAGPARGRPPRPRQRRLRGGRRPRLQGRRRGGGGLHARHRPPRARPRRCRRCSAPLRAQPAGGRPAARQGRRHASRRQALVHVAARPGDGAARRPCTTGAPTSSAARSSDAGFRVRRHLMVDVLPYPHVLYVCEARA